MSSYVESAIFEHIIKYFKLHRNINVIQTLKAVNNADVYYYFRPHLEEKLKPNSIVTVHHDLNETDKNLLIDDFLNRYKEAEVVVCLNSMQKIVLKEHGIENTIIIPHGYNHRVLTQKKYIHHQKLVIGFFSHFYPRFVKGEDYLVELSSELSPKLFEFVLVGKNRQILAKQLKQSGFECKTYENVPYFMFDELYKMIDCLLITSKYEGGPASFPEALATCTPVLTTKVGMANDFLNQEGVVILTSNIKEDVRTINKFFRNRKSMMDSLSTLKMDKLLKWDQVIDLYYHEFTKISSVDQKRKDVNIFQLYYQIYKYKYKTLYLKKRIILFFSLSINACKIFVANHPMKIL